MSERSKKGKYRPRGTTSKVKFDVLPPQGDPEVSIIGIAALLIGALIAAMLLTQVAALSILAFPLAVGAIAVFLGVMVVRGIRRRRG